MKASSPSSTSPIRHSSITHPPSIKDSIKVGKVSIDMSPSTPRTIDKDTGGGGENTTTLYSRVGETKPIIHLLPEVLETNSSDKTPRINIKRQHGVRR